MTSIEKQSMVLFVVMCIIIFPFSFKSVPVVLAQEIITKTDSVPVKNSSSSVVVSSEGKYRYIEITESCGSYNERRCLFAYSGGGVEYEKIYELHNGMIFKIKSTVEVEGQTWYRVYFDEWLRHPDRVKGDWYIPAVMGRVITDDGEQVLSSLNPSTNKRIVVDLSDHMIYAYDGSNLFMRTKVATGIYPNPTPIGTFSIYKKTPTRYMQGPIEGVTNLPFDLAGVPWNLYFTEDGAVIHGAYWHDRYGTGQSKGCINLPPELAKILYDWTPLGTLVTVQE